MKYKTAIMLIIKRTQRGREHSVGTDGKHVR